MMHVIGSAGLCVVDAFQNGHEVTEYFKNHGKNADIDLLILDLHMPILDGFHTAKWVTNQFSDENKLFKVDSVGGALKRKFSARSYDDNFMRRPLIVACSAMINEEIKTKALAHGFDFVIESPVTFENLGIIVPILEERRKISKIARQSSPNKESDKSVRLDKGPSKIASLSFPDVYEEEKEKFVDPDSLGRRLATHKGKKSKS